MTDSPKKIRMGFALCGSFCTFDTVIGEMQKLCAEGFELYPIMSFNAANTDTRFGSARSFRERIEAVCGREIISAIEQAEPLGPKKILDIMTVAPATGNTIAKLANGIADTPVTLAVKAHVRNRRPVLVAISTNDALCQNAANIGTLMARKHFYFVPYSQDDYKGKPNSAVADFSLISSAARQALLGEQLQPVLLPPK